MKEIPVKVKTERSEDGKDYTYSYFICADRVETGSFFCESFGVRIVSNREENAIVPHITTNMKRIDALVGLLAKNTVSPCNLQDVIVDML